MARVPRRSAGRRFAGCVAVVASLAAGAASADGAVSLQAPSGLQPLLEKHLAFIGEAADGDLDDGRRVAVLRRARKEIAEILATEGYFKPSVEGRETPGGFAIVVEPGPRTTIAEVELHFGGVVAGAAERLDALRAAWALPVGQPFRQADWDAAKQQLLDGLSLRDYAAAAITASEALIDPETASARLRVEIDSGPAFRFGALEVTGLSDYDRGLLARYQPPEPGEPYSQDRLLRYQTALQNTPYFASVVVDIDRATPTPEAAPVQVLVTEAKPRRVGFGVGVSSNTGYRFETSYRDAHFLDRAYSLVSGVRVEQRRQLAYADVFLPPTLSGYLDSVGALVEHTHIAGLQTRRQSFGVVRTIPRGNIENRFAINYQREMLAPDDSLGTRRNALTANWAWTGRFVDNILDPRDGQVLNLQLGGASQAVLSDRNFVRVYGRYQLFLPVMRRDVVILRAEGGMTIAESRDGVPQDFLFRTGGAQTVRGYAYQSLGVQEGSATLGGRYLLTLSAEYTHWLDSTWGVAVFADAGQAGDDRDVFKLAPGYGIGARWKSPAGPLAVDLAWGQREEELRLHFSLAVPF